MSFYYGIQDRLDKRLDSAITQLEDIALNPNPSTEDIEAFNDAKVKVAYSNLAVSEHTRIKHELINAVINGIQ